jgi:hypothetical protein
MKRETLNKILPADKFEELMRLAYIYDMPHRFNDDDDSENAMHEEGWNEMLTCFFGDGKMMMIMIIWLTVTMISMVITTNLILIIAI